MRSRERFEEESSRATVEARLIMAANEYLRSLEWEEIVSHVDNLQLIPGKGEYELVVRFKGGKT